MKLFVSANQLLCRSADLNSSLIMSTNTDQELWDALVAHSVPPGLLAAVRHEYFSSHKIELQPHVLCVFATAWNETSIDEVLEGLEEVFPVCAANDHQGLKVLAAAVVAVTRDGDSVELDEASEPSLSSLQSYPQLHEDATPILRTMQLHEFPTRILQELFRALPDAPHCWDRRRKAVLLDALVKVSVDDMSKLPPKGLSYQAAKAWVTLRNIVASGAETRIQRANGTALAKRELFNSWAEDVGIQAMSALNLSTTSS